jgi:hypothetical protein
MTRGGRPLEVLHDERIELAPRLDHPVAILMMHERIATDPVGQPDVRYFERLPLKSYGLPGFSSISTMRETGIVSVPPASSHPILAAASHRRRYPAALAR